MHQGAREVNERRRGSPSSIWILDSLHLQENPFPATVHLPQYRAALWAWYKLSLDKHSFTMRSQKCVYVFLHLLKHFLGSDGSWNQGIHRFLSQKRQPRRRREEEEKKKKGRAVWLMSTRCLTFSGSHILQSFGWCVICAWAYVRGDAWASFTCGNEKQKHFSLTTEMTNGVFQIYALLIWKNMYNTVA